MIGTILGIFGILITLAFGAYSIWTYKKSKKDVILEFQSKECYSLFRDDVNRLNIELIYKKQTLSNTLILLKAKLINNGHADIDKNRIFSPLKIITTDKYKWLETTITYHPEGASTQVQVLNDNEIQLNWDLLKQNEYLEIEALVEIKNSNKSDGEKGIEFYNSISFDYRITDLNTIQKEKLFSDKLNPRYFITKITKYMAITSFIFGLFFLSFELFPSLNFLGKHIVEYNLSKDNKDIGAYIFSDDLNSIKLKSTTNEPLEITLEEFNKNYKIIGVKKISMDPRDRKFNITIGIVYFILGCLLFILNYKRKRKTE